MKWLYKFLLFTNIIEIVPLIEPSYSKRIGKMIGDKDNYLGWGCYGKYYQISNTKGIKILCSKYSTYEEALESDTLIEAKEEAILLKRARCRYDYIPKCYGVKIVTIRDKFRIGIVMQHLAGPLAGDFCDYDEYDHVRASLTKTLRDRGITHSDLHGNNVIRYKDNWWVIDFTPSCIKLTA